MPLAFMGYVLQLAGRIHGLDCSIGDRWQLGVLRHCYLFESGSFADFRWIIRLDRRYTTPVKFEDWCLTSKASVGIYIRMCIDSTDLSARLFDVARLFKHRCFDQLLFLDE